MLGAILSVAATGFLIGALARLAIPGPDPMPFWLTILIGLGGAALGGGVTGLLIGSGTNLSSGDYFWILLASVAVAAGLVAAYRHFVQKRPISGPGARRFPTRVEGRAPCGARRAVRAGRPRGRGVRRAAKTSATRAVVAQRSATTRASVAA